METKNLDVVYCIKNAPTNEELRYSLRSLKNIPHSKVWIFGYAPEWIRSVEIVRQDQKGLNKWEKCGYSLKSICENEGVTEDFIWFNDDFFVMSEIEKLPYYIDRTLEERFRDFKRKSFYGTPSRYAYRLQDAANALKTKGRTTVNYELHIPMIFNRKKLLKLWDIYPNIGAHRSLYGNEYSVGGEQRYDVKIYNNYSKPSLQVFQHRGGRKIH